jgi:hypothetical protein
VSPAGPRIHLGLGETAKIRPPTKRERAALGLRTTDLIVEYRHPDRAPDIFPARGLTICPRTYGVRLPDGGPQEDL